MVAHQAAEQEDPPEMREVVAADAGGAAKVRVVTLVAEGKRTRASLRS